MKGEYTFQELTRLLPEVRSWVSEEIEEDGPYVAWGFFAAALRKHIESGLLSKSLLDRLFGFLQEMGDSQNVAIENQLVVGVFEPLSESSTAVSLVRERLSGKAKDLFERTLRGWAASPPDSKPQRTEDG